MRPSPWSLRACLWSSHMSGCAHRSMHEGTRWYAEGAWQSSSAPYAGGDSSCPTVPGHERRVLGGPCCFERGGRFPFLILLCTSRSYLTPRRSCGPTLFEVAGRCQRNRQAAIVGSRFTAASLDDSCAKLSVRRGRPKHCMATHREGRSRGSRHSHCSERNMAR